MEHLTTLILRVILDLWCIQQVLCTFTPCCILPRIMEQIFGQLNGYLLHCIYWWFTKFFNFIPRLKRLVLAFKNVSSISHFLQTNLKTHEFLIDLQVPPYVLIFLTFTSYRIHSIFVLRLFNDPIAIILAYFAMNQFLKGRWTLGSLSYRLVEELYDMYANTWFLVFPWFIGK